MGAWTLSGFGDEIAVDPVAQLETLASLGIRSLDLRAAWDTNVVHLSDDQIARLATLLAEREMAVSVIASPIGKIGIDEPFEPHLAAFRRALTIAGRLGARYVRVFSFYLPAGDDPAQHRDAVLDRLGRLVREVEGTGLTLLHENERGIYGDTPDRCHDLLATIDSPLLRAVWDPANFVLCDVAPFADGFERLHPFIAALHVKDAVAATGRIVPAGEGDGDWPATLTALRDSGFAGVCSLEPHLGTAGPSAGYSGPDGFRRAATAFMALLRRHDIDWTSSGSSV